MADESYANAEDQLQYKLFTTHRLQLSIFLDEPPMYFKLLKTLPDPANESKLMYVNKNIRMWLDQIKKQNKSPTHHLILDYGTKLAKMRHLLEGLRNARLYEAADYVSEQLLNLGPARRLPGDEDPSWFLEWIGELAQEQNVEAPRPVPVEEPEQPPDLNPLQDWTINIEETIYFSYDVLRQSTGNFNRKPKSEGGAFLGDGGFGDVFYARLGRNRVEVAIKRLKDERRITDTCLQKQMNSEYRELAKFRHENVLRVLGASQSGRDVCIVYQYISNGTLSQHLACADGYGPLTASARSKIAVGVARGIACLHTKLDKPFIHRDIKSPNVLLTADLTPVLGDFGVARYGDANDDVIVETQAFVVAYGYITPEFRTAGAEIATTKDVYCYGVILLELLTGRPAFDATIREPLSENLENVKDVHSILDSKAWHWTGRDAETLWHWAWKCLSYERTDRPNIMEVLYEEKNGLEQLL